MADSDAAFEAALVPYRALLAEFESGHITADDFEAQFMTRYQNDPTLWPPRLFDILDGLFAAIDDYVPDAELRARAGGIDGPELRRYATEVLSKLVALLDASE